MSLTPALFTSNKPDGPDTTLFRPSVWDRVVSLLNSVFDGADTHGSVLYRDTSDTTDGASYAPSASGVLACAGSGQAPAFRALATTDLPAGVPLSLFTSTTSGPNSGTTETDLGTYSMPGGTLSVNGQKVRITAWGQIASNANLKTIKLYFGSTVLITDNGTVNGAGFRLYGEVVRTGATTQVAHGISMMQRTLLNGFTSPAETLANAITIKATGQSAVGSNDLTLRGFTVELVP
jgi:hypothetical protein